MAELILECLIQIKALADTPRRLRRRVEAAAAGSQAGDETDRIVRDVLAELVRLDAWAAAALATMLADDQPALATWEGGDAEPGDGESDREDLSACFEEGRRALVARLEGCSTEQLRRVARVGGRDDFSVSDLVAVLLAHDTDQLGRLYPRYS